MVNTINSHFIWTGALVLTVADEVYVTGLGGVTFVGRGGGWGRAGDEPTSVSSWENMGATCGLFGASLESLNCRDTPVVLISIMASEWSSPSVKSPFISVM